MGWWFLYILVGRVKWSFSPVFWGEVFGPAHWLRSHVEWAARSQCAQSYEVINPRLKKKVLATAAAPTLISHTRDAHPTDAKPKWEKSHQGRRFSITPDTPSFYHPILGITIAFNKGFHALASTGYSFPRIHIIGLDTSTCSQ